MKLLKLKLLELLLDNRSYFIKNENNYSIYTEEVYVPPRRRVINTVSDSEHNFLFILNIISLSISYIFLGIVIKNIYHFIFG